MNNLQLHEGHIILILVFIVVILSFIVSKQKKKIRIIKELAQKEADSAREEALATKSEHEKQTATLKSNHAEEISAMRIAWSKQLQQVKENAEIDCSRKIQQVKEEIQSNKKVLMEMEDKELLASIMISLAGYGDRFERIEGQLTDSQLFSKVSQLMQDLTTRLNNIECSLANRIEEMNSSLEDTLNDSDLKGTIDRITSDIEDLKDTVDEIKESVGYGISSSLSTEFEDVKDDLSTIRSSIESLSSFGQTIDEIHSSISDKYSYDSLASHISSLSSDLESVKDAVDDAKNAADSARYAAESAKDAADSARYAAESRSF